MPFIPSCVSSAYLGRGQLATELTISADEFDVYEIFSAPLTIAFHLREFNVSCISTSPTLDMEVMHCL